MNMHFYAHLREYYLLRLEKKIHESISSILAMFTYQMIFQLVLLTLAKQDLTKLN